MAGRARLISVVVCLSLAAVAPPATASGGNACANDWPQFRAGPARTGLNPCEGTLNRATVAGGLVLRWRGFTNQFGSFFSSSPAVALGRVFVGSSDDGVWAFDGATGSLDWNAPLGHVLSSPAVAGHTVYVGLEAGGLAALAADTGAVRWTAPTAATDSSPAVWRNRVFIGDNAGMVSAFDARTGDPLWSTPTGGAVHGSPATDGDTVYVGSDDGIVYALNAATGRLRWASRIGTFVRATPALRAGRVYIGAGDRLFALDRATGAVVWSLFLGRRLYVRGSPAVDGSSVYQVWNSAVNEDHGMLLAVSAATGAVRWSHEVGDDFYSSSPSVANGVVYVGALVSEGEADLLYALSTANGRELWTYFLDCCGGAGFGQPAVARGHVYVNTANSDLYAYGLPGA